MDEFIRVLGAPVTAEHVKDLVQRFRLVQDASSPRYWESPLFGVSLLLEEDGAVGSVFLFGNGKDDFREYRGALPGELTFRSGRSDVRRVCGEPTWSANASTVADGPPRHGGWDRYDFPTHNLHFSYERDLGVIELVTVMVAG
jgi:hypothetical protein